MLDLMSIPELKGKKFYVPAYQRGYRWTETEILALLNDVEEFDVLEKGNWYCLQPIVVKKLADNRYELVDGQQRLTTLYIILQTMSERLSNAYFEVDKPDYTIEYETRQDSRSFLENLTITDEVQPNPDYYYLTEAKRTVVEYIKKNNSKIGNLRDKFIVNTKFIWYEIENEDPIAMFKKLNLGKIPLSSSELIKATLLNKRCFDVKNKENLSQNAIDNEVEFQRSRLSEEWDSIEYALNNPEFWGFLSNTPLNESPCMELLFDSIANEYNNTYSFGINANERNFSFLVIWEYLKHNQSSTEEAAEAAKNIWDNVKLKFSRLKEWYSNDKLYHLVGFLVACKKDGKKHPPTVNELEAKLLRNTAKKSEVEAALINEIRNFIGVSSCKGLDELLDTIDYETKKASVTNILLLFNVVTILSPLYGNEKRNKCDMRFPFYIYKDKLIKWDIEHIEAKQQSLDNDEDPDNSLGNLALLDCKTNREYKDASFLEKRAHIREKENEGRFIPICTQNVFNKTYTDFSNEKNVTIDAWDDKDKDCYLDRIRKKLEAFLFPEEVYEDE